VSADTIIPFTFESLPIRGALIHLSRAWKRMQRDHDYDALILETLGHAAAATGLIAQSRKFDGAITLQIQGSRVLKVLVMQCTNELEIRGMAGMEAGASATSFAELTHNARCAITVDNGDRPYQGIVAIDGESLSASLQHYFDHSVQVPSLIALVANEHLAVGILLQQMPGIAIAKDDWTRLNFLLATLRTADFDNDAGLALIGKLFAEDDVRVLPSRSVEFSCRCSTQKVEDLLRMLGEDETRAAVKEHGTIEVVCEFCGETRSFDSVDVSLLFADNVVGGPESVQ
jgi:molecular chaperone Hsp33